MGIIIGDRDRITYRDADLAVAGGGRGRRGRQRGDEDAVIQADLLQNNPFCVLCGAVDGVELERLDRRRIGVEVLIDELDPQGVSGFGDGSCTELAIVSCDCSHHAALERLPIRSQTVVMAESQCLTRNGFEDAVEG